MKNNVISLNKCALIEKTFCDNDNFNDDLVIFQIALKELHHPIFFPVYPPSCHLLSPISRESIVFGSNFRNGDFDGFTRFEVP